MEKGICIIPARGGSKRVTRKNIKPFLDTSLLEITIKEALACEKFHTVLVTSDDPEIIEKATKYEGVKVHNRSDELSSDKATVFEVFHNILKDGYEDFDFVAGVLVTTPFKNAVHYSEAVEKFISENGDRNLISVTKFDYPPQFGFGLDNDELKMKFPEVFAKTTNSKFMESWYHNNGAIWISSVKNYLENKTFYKGDLMAYEMSAIASFDIDYPYQFEIAEILAKKIKNKEITV